jgi:CheY-like chemotaxis protein
MGGTMAVESEVGTGTSFHFCITLRVPTDSPAPNPSEENEGAARNSSGRILLAEDDQVTRYAVRKLLEKAGYTVIAAENGKEALDLLDTEDVDCILMDVQMPVMDGVEATMKIRNSRTGAKADTPIIALTSYAMAGDRERFLDAGMNAYLSKPILMDDLKKTVTKVCGSNVDGDNGKTS